MSLKKNSLFTIILCLLLGCSILAFAVNKKDKNKKANGISCEATGNFSEEVPNLVEIPKVKDNRQEQIIQHTGYTVSYNPDWCIPNWVAYELTRAEANGTGERGNRFEPDPDVKGASPTYKDYSSSKYDRGHMAPAGDMKWDQTAMQECFYLSNICPQDHNLNSGDWNELEMKIRYWARKFGNVYIACGPIMSNNPETIGYNNVAVPDAFFKVCLCQINGSWQAIGFVFQNKAGHQRLSYYSKSVDEVEKITGIDFFPNLEDDLENKVESSVSISAWGL